MADCSKCDGHCCKYITMQVDTPEESIDFEELKWFLCHENILVYIDHEDQWCVEVKTPCKYQDSQTNQCTIYETRPRVCEEHQADECEDNEEYDEHYQRIFRTVADVDEYRKELNRKAQQIRQKSIPKAEAAD